MANKKFKFDVVIGNPPYQEEVEGTSDKQIFPYFMDQAYKIGEKVELITPAKFLSNAGVNTDLKLSEITGLKMYFF
ncbi:Eco57I restriction-modification methylase domain-containing protein, partial [Limosilactobacillus reuteri]